MGVSNTISKWAGRRGEAAWTAADLARIQHFMDDGGAVALPDRVLTAAVNAGIMAASHVPASGAWRDAAKAHPDLYNVLHRLAADTYGYRKVLICEMSSVVQADLLTVRLSASEWKELFEAGHVPVVEHGQAPLQDGRVAFASHDPGSPDVRAAAERIRSVKPQLVYADRDIVSSLQRVLIENIQLPVTLSAPAALKKVHIEADTSMGRAA